MLDKKALYQISSGLYLVSSKNEGHQAGCIINTLKMCIRDRHQSMKLFLRTY